jgi:hypothetical protein
MLLWIDSFDNYGTTTGSTIVPTGILGRKYLVSNITQTGYVLVESGRLGGYSLRIGYDDTQYLSPGPLTTDATLIVGCALKFDSLPTGNDLRFLNFYDGTTLGVNFRLTSGGEIAVYCGATLLGTSAGGVFTAGAWHYMEFKVVCATTTGTWEVHIGGVDVPCGTGVGTTKAGSNDYHTTFRLTGTHTNEVYMPYFDDLYCLDGVDSGITGAANDDFLGNMVVTTILPETPDTAQLDFTPSAAVDHYTCVDDPVCTDDTDYLESSTSGHYDLFNFSDASIAGDIKGIMINADCRETDATSYGIKTVCKSGTTTNDGSTQAIGSTNYVTRSRILETDPDSASLAWDLTGLNAAQFGIKVP